jgi:hypothetical protein
LIRNRRDECVRPDMLMLGADAAFQINRNFCS